MRLDAINQRVNKDREKQRIRKTNLGSPILDIMKRREIHQRKQMTRMGRGKKPKKE